MKNVNYLNEDEKYRILNLHKKFISEQTAADPNATVQQVVQQVVQNPGDKIKTLQGILNDRFKSGLVVDGKWGPKTAAAVQKALSTINTPTNATTTTPTNATTTTPTTATTTPEIKTSDLNKYGLKPAEEYFPNTYSKPKSLENKLGLKP
jgi:peptidoglycan hydrolase-like protein with peptidoglycan-binding domain